MFWLGFSAEMMKLMTINQQEIFPPRALISGLENREYGRRDPSRWSRGSLYPQNLALTSPISGGGSVGIVRSWIQATEL
jgi:hypothetical protein